MPLASTNQVTIRTKASRDSFIVNRRPIHNPLYAVKPGPTPAQ